DLPDRAGALLPLVHAQAGHAHHRAGPRLVDARQRHPRRRSRLAHAVGLRGRRRRARAALRGVLWTQVRPRPAIGGRPGALGGSPGASRRAGDPEARPRRTALDGRQGAPGGPRSGERRTPRATRRGAGSATPRPRSPAQPTPRRQGLTRPRRASSAPTDVRRTSGSRRRRGAIRPGASSATTTAAPRRRDRSTLISRPRRDDRSRIPAHDRDRLDALRRAWTVAGAPRRGDPLGHVDAGLVALSEDRVLAVEVGRGRERDEELAAARARATVRHAEHAGAVVPQRRRKLVDDDVAGAAHAGAGRIAALDHETFDDAVELGAVVVPPRAPRARLRILEGPEPTRQAHEVRDGARRLAIEQPTAQGPGRRLHDHPQLTVALDPFERLLELEDAFGGVALGDRVGPHLLLAHAHVGRIAGGERPFAPLLFFAVLRLVRRSIRLRRGLFGFAGGDLLGQRGRWHEHAPAAE